MYYFFFLDKNHNMDYMHDIILQLTFWNRHIIFHRHITQLELKTYQTSNENTFKINNHKTKLKLLSYHVPMYYNINKIGSNLKDTHSVSAEKKSTLLFIYLEYRRLREHLLFTNQSRSNEYNPSNYPKKRNLT